MTKYQQNLLVFFFNKEKFPGTNISQGHGTTYCHTPRKTVNPQAISSPKYIRSFRYPLISSMNTHTQHHPDYSQATPEEWSQAFLAWIDDPRHFNIPSLSDYAVSRESLYGSDV
jgi:hypothetical protein